MSPHDLANFTVNYKFRNYMKKLFIAFVFLTVHAEILLAQDLTANTFGKGIGIYAKDSSFSMKFSTRFQTLYVGELDLNSEEYADQFLVRRARFKFDGHAYTPKLTYKIELGLSNRDHGSPIPETSNTARIILDAVIKWKFYNNMQLWLGQTKLPGNRERVISSQKLQFVDRSLVNSRYTLDRDIGIQLHNKHKFGENFVVKEALALSMGEGRNITSNNMGGYDYTARIEFLPLGEFTSKGDYFGSDLSREKSPKLAIGLTYDFLDGAARQRGQQGKFMRDSAGDLYPTDLATLFVDAIFKYQGFSLAGEYANKKNQDGIVIDLAGGKTLKYYSGTGYVAQAGYLFGNNLEVAGRYTAIQPDDVTISGISEQTEYTLGLSKYIKGHSLKIQNDYSLLGTSTGMDEFRVRFQVELSF